MARAFNKELWRSITGSWGRFLAIAGIVALGCGFFAGLNMCGEQMRISADNFYDGTNLYDLKLVSTLGFGEDQVEQVAATDGVEEVMPSWSTDVMATLDEQQYVMRVESLPTAAADATWTDDGVTVTSSDASYLNRLSLKKGTWPTAADECVLSADRKMGEEIQLGDTVEVLYGTADLDGVLEVREFTVVGLVSSSNYVCTTMMGSTTLGSGFVEQFMFVLPEAFDTDLPYTQIYLTVEGAADEFSYSDEYWDVVDAVSEKIDADALAQARYDEIRADAQAELDDATADYDEGKADVDAELADAREELSDAHDQLADAQAELADGAAELASSQQQLNDAIASTNAQLAAAKATLDSTSAQLDDAQAQIDAGRSQLVDSQAQVDAGRSQVADGKAQIDAAQAELDQSQAALDAQVSALVSQGMTADEAQAAVADAQAQLDAAQAQLDAQQQALDQSSAELDAAQAQIDAGQAQLDASQQQVNDARQQVADGYAQLEAQAAAAQEQFDAAQAQIDAGAQELADGVDEYEEGLAEYEEGLADYEEGAQKAADELADAASQLAEAQKDIDELEVGDVYVLDRSKNVGIYNYQQDSHRIDNIGRVFPLFFYLIAALVALTTMTRMVEDERVEIGTHKALGYSTARITSKYLVYAFIASTVGAVVGLLVLCQALPIIVMKAYAIMYCAPMPDLPLSIDPVIGVGSAAAGIAVTLAATLFAAWATLRETPATLMLPRAPKAGKRILLERVGPLWSRMSFLWKVTFRNLFRYKRRLAMTIVGIAGCTALLLTGFGIRDSIQDIINNQVDEIIHYDVIVRLDDDASSEDVAEVEDMLTSDADASSFALAEDQNMQAGSDADDDTVAVIVTVPEDPAVFQEFVTMRSRIGHEPQTLDGDAVILTEKLATLLDLKVGDTVRLYEQDAIGNATGEGFDLTVTGIAENYVYNHVYVGQGVWEKTMGRAAEFSSVYSDVTSDADVRDALTVSLHDTGVVEAVSYTDETIETYRESLRSVDMVMVLIVICAAALAFIVLYNLTNINIVERQREIASLKVLGFTRKEVVAYVFRETVLLTCLGALVGLVVGIPMEQFVVLTAEVDVVMFGRVIHPLSFVLGFAVTLGFSVIVMLALRGKLARIDMVESLKSVD